MIHRSILPILRPMKIHTHNSLEGFAHHLKRAGSRTSNSRERAIECQTSSLALHHDAYRDMKLVVPKFSRQVTRDHLFCKPILRHRIPNTLLIHWRAWLRLIRGLRWARTLLYWILFFFSERGSCPSRLRVDFRQNHSRSRLCSWSRAESVIDLEGTRLR